MIGPGFVNFPWQLLCDVTWLFFSFSSILFSSSVIFPSNLASISLTISFCQCLFSSFSIVQVGQRQKQSGRCRTLYSFSVISIHNTFNTVIRGTWVTPNHFVIYNCKFVFALFTYPTHDIYLVWRHRYFCNCPSSSPCLSDSFILRRIWLSFWRFCCIFLKPIVWHSRHLLLLSPTSTADHCLCLPRGMLGNCDCFPASCESPPNSEYKSRPLSCNFLSVAGDDLFLFYRFFSFLL